MSFHPTLSIILIHYITKKQTDMKKYFLATLALASTAFAGMLSLSSCRSNAPENPIETVPTLSPKSETAVLLVTFGSTYPGPKTTFNHEKDFFKQKFPNADQYFSFTSKTIINRMHAKGEDFLAPPLYMQAFLKAKYKNVYVQSLHVIPGEEFTLLADYYVKKVYNVPLIDMTKEELAGRNKAVCGEPLLSDSESIKRVAKILADDYAKELKAGDAVVFVGHGNPEERFIYANMKYVELEKELQAYAEKTYKNPKIYVGTVEGLIEGEGRKPMEMGYKYVLGQIKKLDKAPGKIHLQILMSIAGDHANNDMAGTATEEDGQPLDIEEQSWLNQFKADGYEVVVPKTLKALGDYPAILEIWYEHLKDAIEKANKAEE